MTTRSWVAAVRSRPGLYVGSMETGAAFANLIGEVVSFVCDHLDDHDVVVTWNVDRSVRVHGCVRSQRLRSVTRHIEASLSTLHAGITDPSSSGVRGVGMAAVRALSRTFRVTLSTHEPRRAWRFRFGKKTSAKRPATMSCAEFHFVPDSDVCRRLAVDENVIRAKLQTIAQATRRRLGAVANQDGGHYELSPTDGRA